VQYQVSPTRLLAGHLSQGQVERERNRAVDGREEEMESPCARGETSSY